MLHASCPKHPPRAGRARSASPPFVPRLRFQGRRQGRDRAELKAWHAAQAHRRLRSQQRRALGAVQSVGLSNGTRGNGEKGRFPSHVLPCSLGSQQRPPRAYADPDLASCPGESPLDSVVASSSVWAVWEMQVWGGIGQSLTP